MKKIFLVLLAFAFVSVSTSVFAAKEKPFRGKITYQISYDTESLPEGASQMLPKTMSLYVGENITKQVLFTGMGKQSVIYDLNEKSKTSFIDLMGKKFGIKSTTEEIKKEFAMQPEASIEFLDETKDIAGYPCKKLKLTLKDRSTGDTTNAFAWYTTDLIVNPDINFSDAFFNQVKGVLMEFSLDTGQGIMMNFMATEIDTKKVPAKDFEAPEGYEMITRENLMKMLGGM